jgi:hypothetical protein
MEQIETNLVLRCTPVDAVQTTYYITEDALFKPVPLRVDIENLERGDTILRVWVEVTLSYTDHGRNDVVKVPMELEKITHQFFEVQFPEIRGGTMRINAWATIRTRYGQTFTVSDPNPYTASIAAQSPATQKVRDYCRNDHLSVVLYQRSKFRQFADNGQPLYNNGWGLYQLNQPTAEQIWNWKKNADVALADYAKRKEAASKIPATLRTQNPAEYEKLPDFDEEELALETLQSYGTGTYHKPKKSGLFGRWKWEPSGENDGFAKKCTDILKAVQNNKPPEGWN